MTSAHYPWLSEFAENSTKQLLSQKKTAGWEMVELPSTRNRLVRMVHGCYRIVRSETLGAGLSLALLGARYEWHCSSREAWPLPLREILHRERGKGRFHLLLFEAPAVGPGPIALMTLLEDHLGNWHLLETAEPESAWHWPLLTVATHLLTERTEDPARYDDFGDFLELGAPSVVQRHSTERLQKFIAQKVLYDPRLCTHCLRCATACNEMRAIVTEQGPMLVGPSEDFCTNCGLCQKRCSFLLAQPKEELPPVLEQHRRITEGGAGIHLYGANAAAYNAMLQRCEENGETGWPYTVHRQLTALPDRAAAAQSPADVEQPNALAGSPVQAQFRLDPPALADHSGKQPLLATCRTVDSAPPITVIRTLHRAAVVLQTVDGEVEQAMAMAAMELGMEVTAVAPPDSRPVSFTANAASRLFQRLGRPAVTGRSLEDLWQDREVDLFLAPFADRLPVELHRQLAQAAGRQAQILSPQILQALPFAKSPLLGQLRSELARIFVGHPELLSAEAEVAACLLTDIPRHHALLHARYRPLAFASGHTACPTCAEAQVLAVPVYMAMAMSLARREVPQVTFTCETGCMSETLNKVNEVAQKVPGGRTVFGGGFAFGEAMTMAQDRAVRMGALPKGRRYVVSQGGDGGAVIGLPAWLNALRQQAALIKQRHPNVLHFINITDTQVYSNTGGESSASSLLGMGTLTTPIGKFLLGNQKIQWTLINLAAEFPGILVGTGHSANKVAMQQFWQLADKLGQSAIRWDVTPCPETGKFFGDDPDDLAEIMAHAGMLPEVRFVGRFRKRIAPFHPEDRHKPPEAWHRKPKSILSWLHRDPRYRPLFSKDPQTGRLEPRNLTAHYLIAQLASYRDQLNWQIDLETRLVRQAETWTAAFLDDLREAWRRYRYQLDQFPYAMLFNSQGEFKPDYAASLEQELVLRILGWEEAADYAARRDRSFQTRQQQLEALTAELERLEQLSRKAFGEEPARHGEDGPLQETQARIEDLQKALKQEFAALQEHIEATAQIDPVEEEIFRQQPAAGHTPLEQRQKDLWALLDRIIEERALAQQMELQQYRLAQQLKQDFFRRGGLIQETHAATSGTERARLFRQILRQGPFSIGVASLAGDRGIAINRIFANFFTAKGSWAGMAWQFGSSKRGTPVLSATFVDSKPLQRKDAMYSFPMAVLTITNYEDMKRQPDLFFAQLRPGGFVIVNHRKAPQELWQELVSFYPAAIRELAVRLRTRREAKACLAETADGGANGFDKQIPGCISAAAETLLEEIAQELWSESYLLLPEDQRRLADKVAAMVEVRLITVDMDGIMREVAGTPKVVSNLVAVGPMFQALQELGFPFDWEKDLPILTQGFPGAVLKNNTLLNHYYQAMARARQASGLADSPTVPPADGSEPLPQTLSGLEIQESPAEYLMLMGGTLAGMVLSQIATAEHPLFYVGFPITPAGNPFYAMAEAFANGHPHIVVDEVNPSEKVAAEKLLGIARTGGFLPVTFTASQGWRLFTEIIPQFVGARLEGLFLLAKRALAAPNLNIEESHTDFMSFRDDGGIMLAPKGIQEYVPALYLARLLTHFAKIPVILSIGGITDTHKIGLVKVPSDQRVRSWLRETLAGFDFLEHKLINREGDLIVHGPSGTSAVYQETQSELEKAHQAVTRIYPYAVEAVHKLTGIRLDEIEVCAHSSREEVETLFILQGSWYPNAVEALRELEESGWTGMACLSLRTFNPFPEEKLFGWFERASRIVVLDRSNSFGAVPPLASRVLTALARYHSLKPDAGPRQIRTLVGGLGGREVTVKEMREILLSTHLLLHPPEEWERPLVQRWLHEDTVLEALLDEAAALDIRNTNRHTRVPEHLRDAAAQKTECQNHRERLVELLAGKHYPAFLANYHQVEFVAPREVLQETSLLQQIVLHLEMRLARHAFTIQQGTPRHALLLLHYSSDAGDHQTAAGFLQRHGTTGRLSPRLLASYGVAVDSAPASTAAVAEPRRQETSQAKDSRAPGERLQGIDGTGFEGRPQSSSAPTKVTWDHLEAARIAEILRKLVEKQGEEPLCYNPEDYEQELLRQLRHDPESPLRALDRQATAEQADALLLDYQACYRDVIDHTLQREILVRHYAPELRHLFEGDGHRRLEELVARLEEIIPEGAAENRQAAMAREVEQYLIDRCLSGCPKPPAFYLEYYRNWVAPTLLGRRET